VLSDEQRINVLKKFISQDTPLFLVLCVVDDFCHMMTLLLSFNYNLLCTADENKINSERYIDDEEFQDCLPLIKSSSRQIGLNLSVCRHS
jgi:hypothetical protein